MAETDLGEVALVAAIPGLVLVLATSAALRFRLSDVARSSVQHLAAGVVTAVVAVEVLPDLLADHEPWLVTLGLATGGLAMVAIGALSEGLEERAASVGFALGATLVNAGWAPPRIVTTAALLGSLELAAAIVGAVALAAAPQGVQVVALSIGAAALLYLVTEELLTEAHETPERSWQTGVFFGGFIVVFLVESLS